MSDPASSRQTILDSIRGATRNGTHTPYPELPRNYVHRGALDRLSVLHQMIERLHEYGAEVAETDPANLPSIIADQLRRGGRNIFVIPPALKPDWPVTGIQFKPDRGLSYDEIEKCDGVITESSAGIADSGTIALHHSPTEGRRIISLLPDWHLCSLRTSQIVETLPEYFARCPQPPALVTWISGPSATADIEMTRIKGVHGPRLLNVVLVHDELSA
jgi:L-lactate dehydrogenase complex protein LldG